MSKTQPTAKQDEKAPVATEVKPVEPKEPTSEKLVELKKAKAAAYSEGAKLQIAGKEKEAEDKFMEAYKLGEDIKREIAAIKQHEAELLKKEKEAAIVKMFDDAISAHDANQAAIGNKHLSIEEKNALNDAYHAAREAVVNRLLGSRPAGAAKVSTGTGTKGATGTAIHELIVSGLAEGKSLTEVKKSIVEAGYSRGTTGAVATQMIKDGEITA